MPDFANLDGKTVTQDGRLRRLREAARAAARTPTRSGQGPRSVVNSIGRTTSP